MKIYNDRYEVTFVSKGGEIYSFTDKENNIQYMYQGDSKYWGGKNPTLFPIVGNTKDGTYKAKGKTYTFKNHGIIRISDLTCISHTQDSITFELKSNEETLKTYPYAFTYHITYTLQDNILSISYDIKNEDTESMPFGFGLHPGFKVPLCEDEVYEDYTMSLDSEETVKQFLFDRTFVRPFEKFDVTLKDIPMDYDTIHTYQTLIYEGIQSKYVTLKGKHGHGVKMSTNQFPFLGVWNNVGAPYVCIEPWHSHDDFEKDIDVPFKDRVGMINLDVNEHYQVTFTIEVF